MQKKYKTLHKRQDSVTVQLRFVRSSVTFCAPRDSIFFEKDEDKKISLWNNETIKNRRWFHEPIQHHSATIISVSDQT